MNLLIQLSCIITALSCFYLLAIALKDSRSGIDYPTISAKILRMGLAGVMVSATGFLIVPDLLNLNLSVLIISVGSCVLVMSITYRRNYLPMEIDFIDHESYINFPKDRYAQIKPGVFCRNYDFDGLVVAPFESELINIAKDYDPKRWTCVFFDIGRGLSEVDADGNPDFPNHRHRNQEKTHLSKGRAEIINGWPDLTSELPFTVPPKRTHYFKRKGHCLGASFVEK